MNNSGDHDFKVEEFKKYFISYTDKFGRRTRLNVEFYSQESAIKFMSSIDGKKSVIF